MGCRGKISSQIDSVRSRLSSHRVDVPEDMADALGVIQSGSAKGDEYFLCVEDPMKEPSPAPVAPVESPARSSVIVDFPGGLEGDVPSAPKANSPSVAESELAPTPVDAEPPQKKARLSLRDRLKSCKTVV